MLLSYLGMSTFQMNFRDLLRLASKLWTFICYMLNRQVRAVSDRRTTARLWCSEVRLRWPNPSLSCPVGLTASLTLPLCPYLIHTNCRRIPTKRMMLLDTSITRLERCQKYLAQHLALLHASLKETHEKSPLDP